MASDLIISFLSSVPADVMARFTNRPLTLAVPAAPVGHGRTFYADYLAGVRDGKGNVIPGLFRRAGGTGPIGRVCVIGFSNGVDSGVSQVLEGNDAQKIDVVGAFDGIHGSFFPGTTQMNPAAYNKWIAFGRLAAQKPPAENGPLLLVTHSSIEPSFPSTSETANLLFQQIVATAPSNYESAYWGALDDLAYPGGLSIKSADTDSRGGPMPSWVWKSFNDGWIDRRAVNGFSVFGWGDPGVSPHRRILAACRDRFNATADHRFQAMAVLPAVLSVYLAPRWNPEGAAAGIGRGPFGDAGPIAPSSRSMFGGRTYDEGPDGPLANPFPLGVSLPVSPVACPYPTQPGQVIVGSPGDPCSTVAAPLPPPPVVSSGPFVLPAGDVGLSLLEGLLVTGASALGGYAAVRALRRRLA